MGLIRKQSLYQLLMIQNMMKQEVGKDVGEETTKDIVDVYDSHNDTDITSEAIYDVSNEIQHSGKDPDWNYITRFGQGNLGECLGDLTDQKWANNYWTHNPLDIDKDPDTYEDLDHMFNFAPSWLKRNKNKVQKFDYPDQELFKPPKKIKKIKENHSLNESHICKFDEFIRKK
jgi:hypothetical protein